MRVVHVMKMTGIAGAEKHLLTLLPGLAARGLDPYLIALVEPENPVAALTAACAEASIPFERVIIHSRADLGIIDRLRRRFTDLQPDIVHTHLQHADLFGTMAARLARIPVVITTRHNDDAIRHAAPIRAVNAGVWRAVDAGIMISDAIRRFSVEVEGAPPDKLHTIHYGLPFPIREIDPKVARADVRASLNLPAETILIGVVCRLVEQKGVRYGIEAFAQVADEVTSAHLMIVGDGDQRRDLEAFARSLNLMERITFAGWRDDVQPILAGLDVLLAPSLWEGFGLVLLEAMSRRLPIVASRVSAIPEVVADGETGLLVPPRDVPALADAMRRVLDDQPLRRHMGLMGEDRLEMHFDAHLMIDKTAALYDGLLAR